MQLSRKAQGKERGGEEKEQRV